MSLSRLFALRKNMLYPSHYNFLFLEIKLHFYDYDINGYYSRDITRGLNKVQIVLKLDIMLSFVKYRQKLVMVLYN